ncbi:MAG: endolytic transglycosylase MltG [Xanthomonadales bacterium]|nr:endolytic transglycosylase MltG [Xanthomonadales bacterium]MDH4021156.1 endolytic transglycosylase MltG [Xanthomonadales bacterium]
MKRLLPVVLIVLLLSAAGLAGLWNQYQQFLQTPLQMGASGMVIVVEPGTNIRSLAARLQQQGATRLDWRWRLLGRLKQVTIKTGEYQLRPGLAPPELLDLLASGKVVNYRFTIVEGWSVKQLLKALHENPVLEHRVSNVAELESLEGFPKGNSEGWFLPETYVFVRGDSDQDILKRAYDDMLESLEVTWNGREDGLPFETQYELLIMASIIEKETSLESERADIAGVFVRRLQQRWRLETDPTVIYGMGDTYQGNIRRKDLKMDTPYNTYTRHGLPPTPIALPGLASLQAAAHPAAGDAMFFVANGKGGHTFSSTLEAHNKAVRLLIKQTRVKSNEAGGGQ